MPDQQNKLTKFWKELGRRKVVRVIIVYATTAFVIMQFANLLETTFTLPDWFDKMITILLIIGFPIAVIFSWIFDLSSNGIAITKPLSDKENLDSNYPTVEEKIIKSVPEFLSEQNVIETENTLFVAREYEISLLENVLEKACAGKGQFYFITGEAGSGKTTLVHKFINEAQKKNDDLIVLYGKCDAHTGIGNPYLPFREMLSLLLCEIETKWEAGAINSSHAKRLYDFFPISTEILVNEGKNLIGSFVPKELLTKRIKEYPVKNDNLSNQNISKIESFTEKKDIQSINQNDLFEQFFTIVQHMSKKKPLLLVIDDLQWIDKGSANLLGFFGQQISSNRVMVIGTYRPEEVALGRGKEQHPLEAVLNKLKRIYGNILYELDFVDGKLFIDELLDSEQNNLDNDFRKTLLRQTKGHPLFTVELVKEMQERGVLIKDSNGFWNESNSLKWDNIPVRIDAIIGERLGRLTGKLKKVLIHASIMGEEFVAEVVSKQCNIEIKELIGIFSTELEKKYQLVYAKGVERINGYRLSYYQFRHVLFQKHLYNSLDDVERAFLHEETGKILEETFSGHINDEAVQLAWHFYEAGIIDKAIFYQRKAALHAKSIYANDDAIELFKKVLELIDRDNSIAITAQNIKLKAEVQEEMGKLYALKNMNEEARNSFLMALSLIGEENIIWHCRLHRQIATTYMNQKQFDNSLNEFNKANTLLGENALEPADEWWHEKIEIENERIWLFYWQAKIDDMILVADKIHTFIEEYGKPGQRAKFYQALVLLDYRRFRYRISDETIAYSRAALKASLETDNIGIITMSNFLLGFTLLWHGSLEEAEIYFKTGYELAEKMGDEANQSRVLNYLIILYRRLNNLEKVTELIPVCLDISEKTNMTEYIASCYANKAWTEMKKGNTDQIISNGVKALNIFDSLPKNYASSVVGWIALLPLISVHFQQNNLTDSIQYARRLTDKKLMLLDGNIVDYANRAVQEWDSGNLESASELIKQIEGLAKKHRYI